MDIPIIESPACGTTEKVRMPIYKRYPESKYLTKSCYGPGWGSVHRAK